MEHHSEGSEAKGPGGHFGELSWSDAADKICSTYGLKHTQDFHYALEQLCGIARLEGSLALRETNNKVRRQAAESFRDIAKNATKAHASLKRVVDQLASITSIANENAPLSVVERVMLLNPHSYDAYHPPELFNILRILRESEQTWRPTFADLDRLSQIKPGSGLTKEWSSSTGLIRALEVCRSYLKHEGIGWSINSLEKAAVRKSGDLELIRGKAERLVLEMLLYEGLGYSFTSVFSAWKDVKYVAWRAE
jgi:hypothetical protein